MQFHVRVGEQALPVEFDFGGDADVARLRLWKRPPNAIAHASVADALEYARYAAKRWRSYRKEDRTVRSAAELRLNVTKEPRGEFVFVLVTRADWHRPSPLLGFCFCRRTWCHHIVVDFAAVHPNALSAAGGAVRGVGAGMFYSLVKFADQLGVQTVWGEATENSAPFYEKLLALPRVTDHFFITGEVFQHCLRGFANLPRGA
jgi:hypothetical protein